MTTTRLCWATLGRLPRSIREIRDRLAAGRPIRHLALAVAAWVRRLALVGDGALVIRHPLADELRARARSGHPDPASVLAMTEVFGDLSANAEFTAAVTRASFQLAERPPDA